jgi:hypothetical protein
METEKLKLTTRLKIKTWGNQQIQNNKNSHELKTLQTRHNREIQNTFI